MGARSWSEQLRPKKTICYFTTRSQKPEPAVSVPAMPQVTPEPPAAPVVNDAPTLSNRIFGTLTAIGGIAEAAVGGIGVIAGIGSANPLLIGGGGVVGLNGIDNAQAGMRQAISGKPVQTATSTAVEAVTGSHLAGEGTNLAIGLVGSGAVAKVATGKGLIASIKSVGSDTWKGIKNAGTSIKNWWKGTPKINVTDIRGIEFEKYLVDIHKGQGSFSMGGRQFDGAKGSRWWEAKSGRYWEDHCQIGEQFNEFKTAMGQRQRSAKDNGATLELHSNSPVPQYVKIWCESRGIKVFEYLQ